MTSERQRARAADWARGYGRRRRSATYARDLEIVRRLAVGESVRVVARAMGVSHQTAHTARARLRRAPPPEDGNPERFRAMAEIWGRRALAAIQRGDDGDGAYWAAHRAAAWAGIYLRHVGPRSQDAC